MTAMGFMFEDLSGGEERNSGEGDLLICVCTEVGCSLSLHGAAARTGVEKLSSSSNMSALGTGSAVKDSRLIKSSKASSLPFDMSGGGGSSKIVSIGGLRTPE